MQKNLKKACNLSYKCLSYCKPTMETEETKLQRYTFVLEMIPALLGDFIPIFIDEAGISLT